MAMGVCVSHVRKLFGEMEHLLKGLSHCADVTHMTKGNSGETQLLVKNLDYQALELGNIL